MFATDPNDASGMSSILRDLDLVIQLDSAALQRGDGQSR